MSVSDFMPKKYRNGEPKLPDMEPIGEAKLPRVNMKADAAMKAAEHVVDLEDEVAFLIAERDAARAKVAALDARVADLEVELEQIRKQRDRYQHDCVAIKTQLEVSAKIIIDAMNAPSMQQIKKDEAVAKIANSEQFLDGLLKDDNPPAAVPHPQPE